MFTFYFCIIHFNFFQIVSLLILSGDVEQNPGPVNGTSTGGKSLEMYCLERLK